MREWKLTEGEITCTKAETRSEASKQPPTTNNHQPQTYLASKATPTPT